MQLSVRTKLEYRVQGTKREPAAARTTRKAKVFPDELAAIWLGSGARFYVRVQRPGQRHHLGLRRLGPASALQERCHGAVAEPCGPSQMPPWEPVPVTSVSKDITIVDKGGEDGVLKDSFFEGIHQRAVTQNMRVWLAMGGHGVVLTSLPFRCPSAGLRSRQALQDRSSFVRVDYRRTEICKFRYNN